MPGCRCGPALALTGPGAAGTGRREPARGVSVSGAGVGGRGKSASEKLLN